MRWLKGLTIRVAGLVILPLLGLCVAVALLIEHFIHLFQRRKPATESSETIGSVLGDILYQEIGNFITDILNTPHPR